MYWCGKCRPDVYWCGKCRPDLYWCGKCRLHVYWCSKCRLDVFDVAMNSGLLTIWFLSYECQFDYMISFLVLWMSASLTSIWHLCCQLRTHSVHESSIFLLVILYICYGWQKEISYKQPSTYFTLSAALSPSELEQNMTKNAMLEMENTFRHFMSFAMNTYYLSLLIAICVPAGNWIHTSSHDN